MKTKRVDVWDGSGKNYLGQGDLVGKATVYFIALPDGDLLSRTNAEEKPSEEEVLACNGRLIESSGNPKIVLDNGKTVYGCQVWWQPIREKQ